MSTKENIGVSLADNLAARGLKLPSAKENRKFGGQPVQRNTAVQTPAQSPSVFKLPRISSLRSMSKQTMMEQSEQLEKDIASNMATVADNIEFIRLQRKDLNNKGGLARKFYEEDETDFIEATIGGISNEENSAVRRTYVEDFVKKMVATCPALRTEILWTAEMLIEAGFFIRGGRDIQRIYDLAVDIAPEYREDRDAKKAANDLLTLVDKAREAGRQQANAADKAIEEAAGPIESRLAASQFGYKDGQGLIIDPGWTDREGRFHRGGKLLVTSTSDGWLFLRQATNGVRRLVEEIAKAEEAANEDKSEDEVDKKITISINEIGSGHISDAGSMEPNFYKTTFKVLMTLKRALEYSIKGEEIAEKHKEFQIAADNERKEFALKANLTAEQFHTKTANSGDSYFIDPLGHRPFLDRKIENGKPVVDEEKSKQQRRQVFKMIPVSEDAYDVFFLAIVGEKGAISYSFPERLTKFFSDFPQAFEKLIKMDRNRLEKSGEISKEARLATAEARREQKAKEFDQSFEATMLAVSIETETAVTEEAIGAIVTPTKARRTRKSPMTKKVSSKTRATKIKA